MNTPIQRGQVERKRGQKGEDCGKRGLQKPQSNWAKKRGDRQERSPGSPSENPKVGAPDEGSPKREGNAAWGGKRKWKNILKKKKGGKKVPWKADYGGKPVVGGRLPKQEEPVGKLKNSQDLAHKADHRTNQSGRGRIYFRGKWEKGRKR